MRESKETGAKNLWTASACCMGTVGFCLIGTMIFVDDPKKLFGILYGTALVLSGSCFLGSGILLSRAGLFAEPKNQPEENSTVENSVLLNIENRI